MSRSNPTVASTLIERVRSNDSWLAHCNNLYREQQKRDGQYARKLREDRGISLRQLAGKMGISAMMLSDLERGNRNWTISTLEAWERALK